MSSDPCMAAALTYVRRLGEKEPGKSSRISERLYMSVDDHYLQSGDIRKKAAAWEDIAKDLAEAGSAIMLSLGQGCVPPTTVIGFWLEAAAAYDAARVENNDLAQSGKAAEEPDYSHQTNMLAAAGSMQTEHSRNITRRLQGEEEGK